MPLYRQRGPDALAELHRDFAALPASLWLRVRTVRIPSSRLQGRLWISKALHDGDRAARRRAAKHARSLVRERCDHGTAFGLLIRAAVAAQQGRDDRAVADLRRCIASAVDCDMHLAARCGEWRLGQMLGGDEGAQLIAAARQWMKSQAIADPEALLEMYAPGYPDSPG